MKIQVKLGVRKSKSNNIHVPLVYLAFSNKAAGIVILGIEFIITWNQY